MFERITRPQVQRGRDTCTVATTSSWLCSSASHLNESSSSKSMEGKNVSYVDDYTILTVLEHKTSRKYGPVVVALPPYYCEDFKLYMEHWDDLHVLLHDKLFIKRNGWPDKYLTRRFQAMTSAEFGVDVSIRDCRSIFINFAKDKMDLTQMYELSRQMCHSFQMQQSEYRADNSIDHAIGSMRAIHEMTPLLPLCSVDQILYQEELAETQETNADEELADASSNDEGRDNGIETNTDGQDRGADNEDQDNGLEATDDGQDRDADAVFEDEEDSEDEGEFFLDGPSDEAFIEFVDSYNATHSQDI